MSKLHEKLLDTARLLLGAAPSLGSAGLRRAASTAYYALFSRLSALCARALARSRSNSQSFRSAYRMLDHGPTKDALNRDADFKLVLGEPFALLQEVRNWADYDISAHPNAQKAKLGKRFSRPEARRLVNAAADAIVAIDRLNASARQRLAVILVARTRR